MTSLYEKFRSEIAAGGAAEDVTPETKRQSVFIGFVMLALLLWLAIQSFWTFIFVLGLIVSVFLHEVGHFVTARWTGMKSTQFFMGFGPRVWSMHRKGVEYGVRAIPAGAFVRIIGMNNLDEVEPEDEPMAYRSKSYPRRMLVITAGSLMHMIIAFALFTGVYVTAGRIQETGTVAIAALGAGDTPAVEAGLLPGDVLVSIGGTSLSSRDDVVTAVTSYKPGDQAEIIYVRDDVQQSVTVTFDANPGDPSVAYLGVASDSVDYVSIPLHESMWRGVQDIGDTVVGSVKGVVTVLNPVNSIRHLTGEETSLETRPTTLVGVSQVGGDIGRSDGVKGVLLLLASVNVFVGIFNMFPLLPFDGGHAAIATYERIRSRKGRTYRADISKMVPVATTVVALMALLLFTGLYLDITQPL
jgi:membrane-associated protease RseP (regulator of RpoE activity)